MATAGMVLGIFGLMTSFIPLLGILIATPCFVVGLPLSAISLFRPRIKRRTVIGVPIAGLVTSILGALMVSWQFYVFIISGENLF